MNTERACQTADSEASHVSDLRMSISSLRDWASWARLVSSSFLSCRSVTSRSRTSARTRRSSRLLSSLKHTNKQTLSGWEIWAGCCSKFDRQFNISYHWCLEDIKVKRTEEDLFSFWPKRTQQPWHEISFWFTLLLINYKHKLYGFIFHIHITLKIFHVFTQYCNKAKKKMTEGEESFFYLNI